MHRFLLLMIAVWSLFGAPALQAQAIPRVNVERFGAAGDGVTDDTEAFQKALDEQAQTGGIVLVPVGRYLIKGNLRIPEGVTLEGVWQAPPRTVQRLNGSHLLAVAGEGDESAPPFITMHTNSTIKGIVISYPNQSFDDIKPYPWCIQGAGGDNVSIIDCLLVNPYNGVDLGTHNSGRHYVRGLYGQPLRRGLYVDKCYDIGRIENVHFWPFWGWDGKPAFQKWMAENSEAFVFGRTDWEYVLNTFCFGYKVGYRFIETPSGSMNGNLLGIGADATHTAVLVEQSQKPGLLITNGEFVSFQGEKPTAVVVKAPHSGVVQFVNCAFWGPAYQIARIAGSGDVTFQSCNFVDWGHGATGSPVPSAIEVYGGHVSIQNSLFHRKAPQFSLRTGARSGQFIGNRLAGPVDIQAVSGIPVQSGLNIEPPPPMRPAAPSGGTLLDDSDKAVRFVGEWTLTEARGNVLDTVRWAPAQAPNAQATYPFSGLKPGVYRVRIYVPADPNKDHATDVPVKARTSSGALDGRVNQRLASRWVDLGMLTVGSDGQLSVTIGASKTGNTVADAVMVVPVTPTRPTTTGNTESGKSPARKGAPR